MITQIEVKNFQSHKHTVVSLKEGFTVVIGDSDQGKTSLIKRALSWVFYNEPTGDSFIRYKDNGELLPNGERKRENFCCVTVTFDNGTYVKRIRDKKKNIYEWLDEYGEEHFMENFGVEVPLDVQKTLGIFKLTIEEDLKLNVNIIGSRDTSLLDKTGSAKAKVIGSFAGTNYVDNASRTIATDIKRLSTEKEMYAKEAKMLTEKVENFGQVKEYEEIINNIDKTINPAKELNDSALKIINKTKKIFSLEETVIKNNEFINKTEKMLKEKEFVLTKLKTVLSDIAQNTTSFKNVKNIFTKIHNTEIELNKANEIMKNEKNIVIAENVLLKTKTGISEIKEDISKYNQVLQIYNKLISEENKLKNLESKLCLEKTIKEKEIILQNVKNNLTTLNSDMHNYMNAFSIAKKMGNFIVIEKQEQEKIKKLETNISVASKEYTDCLSSLEVCPFCKQVISDEHIKDMLNNI